MIESAFVLRGVADYLEKLPAGIESYPTAEAKSSVIAGMLGSKGFRDRLSPGDVPPEVESLIHNPPRVGDWIPETQVIVCWHAAFDLYFAQGDGLPAYERSAFDRMTKIMSGPLYRVLFFVLSPERVLIGAETRWKAFHRGGIDLRVRERGKGHALLELRFPRNLVSDLALRTMCQGIHGAAVAAGMKASTLRVVSLEATSAVCDLSWS